MIEYIEKEPEKLLENIACAGELTRVLVEQYREHGNRRITMRSEIRIASAGDNCMDVYDGQNQVFPGGNPVNVAVYAARLGCRASYTGVVGTDAYGEKMIEAVKGKGVDTSHLRSVPGSTAVTHVEIRDGERILGVYEEGVLADFALTEEDLAFLCGHDLVVTGIWGKIEGDLPKIKERGVPVAFDFATKLEDLCIEKALPYVDYAFFSYDEGQERELYAFMKRMYAYGPKIVIVTLGEKGSVAYDGKDFTHWGIVPCRVADTMGAGDSYIAGFLVGILEGKELKECMRQGAENSAVTLGYPGAW